LQIEEDNFIERILNEYNLVITDSISSNLACDKEIDGTIEN